MDAGTVPNYYLANDGRFRGWRAPRDLAELHPLPPLAGSRYRLTNGIFLGAGVLGTGNRCRPDASMNTSSARSRTTADRIVNSFLAPRVD
jgi:hypothetical protein